MSDAMLQLSPYTGRPLPRNSAIAAARIAAAAPAKPAALAGGIERIVRPQAAYRWILPQLTAITPTYIESVLRGAFAGSHLQQWELFDLMEDTWPRLSKNLNELKRAAMSLNWKVEAYHEEDEAPSASATEKARLIGAAMKNFRPDPPCDEADFKGMVFDILDAWAKGVSVLEVLWHQRSIGQLGDVTIPRATVWIRPDGYAWTSEGRLGLNPQALLLPGSENGSRPRGYLETASYYTKPENVLEFPPGKFLIAINKAKSGHPLASALLRPLAWWWCAANFSADWLMNLAQVFGLPFRWANYEQGAPQTTIDAICSMLENMGSAGWAAFPSGTTLELKEASKTGDASPQADLVDRADKNCDLLILGQTLTTDSGNSGSGGGSLALGKVHQGVREDVILAAGQFAAGVINSQLIPAILTENYGDTDEAPTLCAEPHKEEDQSQNAATLKTLIDAGLGEYIGVDWALKKFNIPRAAEGDETLKPEEPEPAPAPGDQPVNGEDDESEDSEDRMSAKGKAEIAAKTPPLADELARAIASDLRPVMERLTAILGIKDPEIFRARLTQFKADLAALGADIAADPQSARVIETIIGAGLAQGLAKGRPQNRKR